MKSRKIVIIVVVITVVLATPWITASISKRHRFEFLSEQFLPVFNVVNQQLGNEFSYKDALYFSDVTGEYSLEYTGEDSDFLDRSIAFCNLFSTAVMEGEYHDTARLRHGYVIRIKSSSLYLNCWYGKNSSSLNASTNATSNCTAFEALTGTTKLTVVTKDFTEEQKEYAKSFQDKCSFELVFSYKMPW